MEERQRFRELAKRIEAAAEQLQQQQKQRRPAEEEPVHNTLDDDDDSRSAALAVGSLLGGGRAEAPRIVLPGAPQRRLVAMVGDDDSGAEAEDAGDGDKLVDQLVAAIEAPLAAGVAGFRSEALAAAAADSGGEWARWWAAGPVRAEAVARHVGAWFARAVVAAVGPLAAGAGGGRLARAAAAYARPGCAVGWQALKAAAGALAGGPAPGALRLAVRVLERGVERGAFDPPRALPLLGAGAEWGDFVQVTCTLPDRVANRVDARSVPAALRPHAYFARLARAAVQCAGAEAGGGAVAALWAKLCRVGQQRALCVELAAALVEAAQARLDAAERAPFRADRLAALARAAAALPEPFRARMAAGVVGQLDVMGAGARLGYAAALALCALAAEQRALDGGAQPDAAAAALVGGLGTTASAGTCQTVALALQLLSGKDVLPAGGAAEAALAAALPDCADRGLLCRVLGDVAIPLWAAPDLLARAAPDAVRPLTALVMACLGALSPDECARLSMGAAFAQAIPRYLDAPTARVRLSGVIVADHIVAASAAARKQPPAADQSGDQPAKDPAPIDFGLDDIIREAQTTGQPHARAAAEYIAEMRAFARPVAEQWAPGCSRPPLPPGAMAAAVAEAVGHMREYSGADADADAVLAPRQASLTSDAQPLASAYVRPRRPAFLRDCLAYLRSSGSGNGEENAERAELALAALAECVDRASAKAVEELWMPVANKVLHTYNRGPDRLDAAWDRMRCAALVALAVRLPARLGPFLADRSSDRNLTAADRTLVLSAIATACLRLSGAEDAADNDSAAASGVSPRIAEIAQPAEQSAQVPQPTEQSADASAPLGVGTVVRRSRRLDIIALEKRSQSPGSSSPSLADQQKKQFAATVGPAFFSPLVAQYGRSDMSAEASDMRRDAAQLERYLSTLGVVLYTARSAVHQLSMNREFWELAKLVRRQPNAAVRDAAPVVDALLFGIDVVLSPDRALSTPTLAREFRADIADTVRWINDLATRGLLADSAAAHAARISARLQEIQAEVHRRVTSGDLHQYTSIIQL
ncbi:telomere binding protein [Coemansia javaensis]|uniref:Telomere binding protein n=1 Tax=Coemansia javaensis TaxID=2761396 RepID=A0A9W8LML5_9FUNG|nr:telomere binding protein [Coemansia javaensis]